MTGITETFSAPLLTAATDPRPLASDWRIDEANRRLEILQTFAALIADGVAKSVAAKQIGQGYATLWRWQKRFHQSGFNGLLPDTDKCGRKSTFARLGLTQEQVEAGLRVEVTITGGTTPQGSS